MKKRYNLMKSQMGVLFDFDDDGNDVNPFFG